MAKVNANHEVVHIMDPLGEEAIAAMIEKFKTLVETQGHGGRHRRLGQARRLAYPINDLNEGPLYPHDLHRRARAPPLSWTVLKITEGVMRSMIICKDE